jgi:hypothetical protein
MPHEKFQASKTRIYSNLRRKYSASEKAGNKILISGFGVHRTHIPQKENLRKIRVTPHHTAGCIEPDWHDGC